MVIADMVARLGGVLLLASCSRAVETGSEPPAVPVTEPVVTRLEPEPLLPWAARNPKAVMVEGESTAPVAAPVATGATASSHDVDLDRIPDELDACPDDAEIYNGIDDEDGCPDGCRLPVLSMPSVVVSFEQGATLPAQARSALEDFAHALEQSGALEVEIAGHSDSMGSPEANDRVAERRALAVRRVLIDGGLSPEILQVVSHGDRQPIAPNTTAEGRSRNRRVEITCLRGC